jgi:hypothetical protein
MREKKSGEDSENWTHESHLTLQAVGVEEVLALFVAFDAALGAADALSCDTPQQTCDDIFGDILVWFHGVFG